MQTGRFAVRGKDVRQRRQSGLLALGARPFALALAAVIFVVSRYTRLKKLHPICFIGFAAAIGILLKL